MPKPNQPAPKQSFEDALGDLLALYCKTDRNTLISAMEIQIMALKEEAEDE